MNSFIRSRCPIHWSRKLSNGRNGNWNVAKSFTGVTAIKHLYAKEIVVAVPVCAPDTCRELRRNVNTFCTCVYAPEHFYAVGLWYKDFHAVTDDEVSSLLEKAGSGAIYATACSESRL